MANEKRLIDANELLRDAEDYGPIRGGLADMYDVKWLVDAQITVDAVEVVHGRWIKGHGLKNTKFIPCSGILYCSNCKNEAYWDTDYGQQKFDYCPDCGAKMDGGNEDG